MIFSYQFQIAPKLFMAILMMHHKYRHEELRRDLKLIGENHRLFGPQINLMPFDYGLDFAGARGTTHNLSAGHIH